MVVSFSRFLCFSPIDESTNLSTKFVTPYAAALPCITIYTLDDPLRMAQFVPILVQVMTTISDITTSEVDAVV